MLQDLHRYLTQGNTVRAARQRIVLGASPCWSSARCSSLRVDQRLLMGGNSAVFSRYEDLRAIDASLATRIVERRKGRKRS